MSCSNCFNGCTEIVSDKCTRYTGDTIASLGITNGDTMLAVSTKLTEHIVSILAGTGIKFDMTGDVCAAVQDRLSACCNEITLKDIIEALNGALCALYTTVGNLSAFVDMLDINYNVDCLTLAPGYDLSDVIQAIILKLCGIEEDFTTLAAAIEATYVRKSELSGLIAQYLIDNPTTTLMKDRMVPYTAVEYYGPLDVFDLTGAGTGDYQQVYLCNGNNGTPDKRGRVGVGAIVGMGGGTLNEAVNPANPGNPNYGLLSTSGANTVNLAPQNLPAHTHDISGTVNLNPHAHHVSANGPVTTLSSFNHIVKNYEKAFSDDDYDLHGINVAPNLGLTSEETVTGTISATATPTGGGIAHSNIQPVLSCYYIIHLPA